MTRPVSAIGEEAARLLAALQEWANHKLGDSAHLATGAPECTVCPLCRAISLLRGDHPEITDKIADAGWSVLVALRALFDPTADTPGATPEPPPPATGEEQAQPHQLPRVQRINLDGDQ